jgi:hypothetical protein
MHRIASTGADIRITNNSGQPVDIHPEQFKVTEAPKTRELKYNDPDALIRSIRRSAGWGAALAASMGNSQTRTTTSQTNGTVMVNGPSSEGSATIQKF